MVTVLWVLATVYGGMGALLVLGMIERKIMGE